jgi:hypothetical protein
MPICAGSRHSISQTRGYFSYGRSEVAVGARSIFVRVEPDGFC